MALVALTMFIGSEDLVLVQNGDSGLGSQRGYGAALHGNTPVGAGGKDRVGRADGLTGQYGDLDGGSLGVDTGHTGSLTDAASLIVALALAEALGVDDGHNGDAVGIAQTNEAGSLGGALVAQGGLLGGQDTNGAAVDGSQRGDDILAVACVQLHSAALIGQSGDRVSRRVLDEVKSFGGSGKVEQRRTGQIVGGQQGDDGGGLLGGGNGVRSGNGGDTGLGGANAAEPAFATLSSALNGAFRNSSASSAMTQTSAAAALMALVPAQVPVTTAT